MSQSITWQGRSGEDEGKEEEENHVGLLGVGGSMVGGVVFGQTENV